MISQIDAIDYEIIKFLGRNARMTNTDIAERLSISEATVRNRIKKLVENRIIQNIAVVNPATLGYVFHSHIGIQVDYRKIKDVAKALKELDAVHFLGSATGRYDLIIFCFFRSVDEQRNFLFDQLAPIEGIVRTETLQILEMYKTKYTWGVSLSDLNETENINKAT